MRSARTGSSPRVRGKVTLPGAAATPTGIIPAGAGKRGLPSWRACQGWDHPRGCGEKLSAHVASVAEQGSSPRVRGKGWRDPSFEWMDGIIPAGAGKSRWRSRRWRG